MAGSGFSLSGDNHSQNSLVGTGGNAGIQQPSWLIGESDSSSPSLSSSLLNPVSIGLGIAALFMAGVLIYKAGR